LSETLLVVWCLVVIASLHDTEDDDEEQGTSTVECSSFLDTDDDSNLLFFLYFYLLQLNAISHTFIESSGVEGLIFSIYCLTNYDSIGDSDDQPNSATRKSRKSIVNFGLIDFVYLISVFFVFNYYIFIITLTYVFVFFLIKINLFSIYNFLKMDFFLLHFVIVYLLFFFKISFPVDDSTMDIITNMNYLNND